MLTLDGLTGMKNPIFLMLACLLAAIGHVLAQGTNQAPAVIDASTSASILLPEMSEAEVRKVDIAAGKVTLRHGEIKNIDMPPMTMVFQVKDRAFLSRLKAGDKVKFTADKIMGAYTVLSIEVIQ